MILFVLEGTHPDVNLYKSLMRVCGIAADSVCAVYGCNIDALYHEMIELGEGADIVEVLRDKSRGSKKDPFIGIDRSDVFSEIYLIFDYDFHDVNRDPEEMNNQLMYLLDYFDEETEHGKMYINYPMVESIRYTKQIPDSSFFQYTVSRDDCRNFKNIAADFSFYPNLDFITRGTEESLYNNWLVLKEQNVSKANYICNGECSFPPKSRDSISQKRILQHQISDYENLNGCRVSVLSSYPILMYDWLGR